MADIKLYGIIATFAVLLAGAGTVYVLNQEQIDNGYVCTTNDNFGVFTRLSATSKTGYWFEGGVEKSATCRNGIWEPVQQYLQRTGKTLNDLREFSSRNLEYNYSVTSECKDIDVDGTIIVVYNQTLNVTYRDNVSNRFITEEQVKSTPTYVSILRKQRHCRTKEVLIENTPYIYETDTYVSKLKGDILCTWSKIDGGFNIEARAPEFQMKIRPGEDGLCINLKQDDSILHYKMRSVLG